METPMTDRIATANIIRVYSGRPGCGCGCRGNYSDRKAQITRVRNTMMARANEVEYIDGIFFIEDGKRNYWAYTDES